MKRQILYGVVFGTLTLAACDGRSLSAPTPLAPPQAAASPMLPSPSSPPTQPPVGTNSNIDSIAGVYTMSLNIGSECAVVPEAERIRQYTATIDRFDSALYTVTLSGTTFLTGPICTAGPGHSSGIGCHQFFASEDIDTVQFFLENNNDDAHGGHIVERSSSGTWLEIIGAASGKLGRSTIEASGSGSVWYCPTPSGYPFPCPRFVGCKSNDMRVSLTRK